MVTDPINSYEKFITSIKSAANSFMAGSKIVNLKNTTYWLDEECQKQRNIRNRALNRFKRNPTAENLQTIKEMK